MRKLLTISAIVIIILCVLGQLVLPAIASRTVARRLAELLDTEEISAEISSVPALLLTVGHLGEVYVHADKGRLGKVRTASLTLTGRNVNLDPSVLAGGRLAVRDAEKLELTGVITEANLEEYLSKAVKKLQEPQVTLTTEGFTASGQAKLLGKVANVEMEGSFEAVEDGIMLHTRKVRITNSRLGRNLDMNLFSDFLIVDVNKIGFPVQADEVVQENGRVIVRASYRH